MRAPAPGSASPEEMTPWGPRAEVFRDRHCSECIPGCACGKGRDEPHRDGCGHVCTHTFQQYAPAPPPERAEEPLTETEIRIHQHYAERLAEAERERDEALERAQNWQDFCLRHPEILPPAVAEEMGNLRAKTAASESRESALREQYDAAVKSATDYGEHAARLAKDLNALRERVRALAEEWQRTSRGWNVSRRAGMRDCAAALRALVADGEGA